MFSIDVFNEWYNSIKEKQVFQQLIADVFSIVTISYFDMVSDGFVELLGEESVKQIIRRLIDSPKNIDDIKAFYPDFKTSKMAPLIGALISFTSVVDSNYFTKWQKIILNLLNCADAVFDLFGLSLLSFSFGVTEKISEYIFRYANKEFF